MSSTLLGLAMLLLMPAGAMASSGQIASLEVQKYGSPVATIDLVSLETKIGDTDALNFLAKPKLKLGINSLTSAFGEFHKGQSANSLDELRIRFEGFLYSTAAMIRKGDPKLAKELVMSRDELWKVLTNPEKILASPETEWASPKEQ